MFLEVDLVGVLVLQVVLSFRGLPGAVLLAVAVDLMVERRFFRFQMRGLAGGQLSGLQFRSAMLSAWGRGKGGLCVSASDDSVVLLVTDGLRHVSLLMLGLNSTDRRNPPAIVIAHVALWYACICFVSFEAGSFAGGLLVVRDSMSDMFLQRFLGLLDGRFRRGGFRSDSGGGLCGNGYRQCSKARCQQHILHRGFHRSMLGQAMATGNAYP